MRRVALFGALDLDGLESMLGMTIETASRLVSALRREGVIEALDTRHLCVAMPRLPAALGRQDDSANTRRISRP